MLEESTVPMIRASLKHNEDKSQHRKKTHSKQFLVLAECTEETILNIR